MNSLSLIQSSLLRTACLTALVTVAALSATAQISPPQPAPAPPVSPVEPMPGDLPNTNNGVPMPNRKAERFISKVSMNNGEEARLSTIAAQRTANEQLRTFAEQIRSTSQTREEELNQLAQTRSVLLPTGRNANDLVEENAEWQKKDAEDFDKDYLNRVIRIHKSAIDTLEDYADDNDSDPELAAYAQKHLAGLRESLAQAENLEKQLD